MSARGVRRHRRLRRVLKAAGIPVLVWQLGRLPSLVKARAELQALGIAQAPVAAGAGRDSTRPPAPAAARSAPAQDPRARAPWSNAEAVSSDFYGQHSPQSTLL